MVCGVSKHGVMITDKTLGHLLDDAMVSAMIGYGVMM
jgi:hypothetical protein